MAPPVEQVPRGLEASLTTLVPCLGDALDVVGQMPVPFIPSWGRRKFVSIFSGVPNGSRQERPASNIASDEFFSIFELTIFFLVYNFAFTLTYLLRT